ncbi:MAG: DUF3365 domain-containing protein [Anaerolineae bacterium]|nr:DUF3365 domain-containing protein [Anaerolineae bacterium]
MSLHNLRITTKFSLLLIIILIGGITVGGIAFRQALLQQTQREINSQAEMLTTTMNSVRSYTSTHIQPLLKDDLETSAAFIPETVPAFSAREVFEQFRQDEKFSSFFYKEATLNPMNPRNQADEFETGLVEQMRSDPELQELTGYRTLFNQEVYYIARPLAIGRESCLLCHANASLAPANLIASYGDDGGFGWQLNEIVAAQMIYVPSETLLEKSNDAFLRITAIFMVVIATVILAINYMLRRFVILPVGEMGKLAYKVAADESFSEELESKSLDKITTRGDELGELGRVFKRMVVEVHERTQKLRQQLQSLRIEIDEIKKHEQIEEVVDTPFFKDLQSKAQNLRNNHEDDE